MARSIIQPVHRLPALLFFFSGFCGLLYQLIWMRLAFASFGVNTPVMSVVLSVFMAGLGLGSWCGGLLATRRAGSSASLLIIYYAIAEALIGLGAFAVPYLYGVGESFLLTHGNADSAQYLLLSALVILAALLPWCFCMGTTFPLMMAYIQKTLPATRSFSFLYTANVLGALTGVFVTAVVLIERLGFQNTLVIGACLNLAIALISVVMGMSSSPKRATRSRETAGDSKSLSRESGISYMAILFLTGFLCMAMEVIWTRDFTLILKTQVYSYASLLFVYLLSTFAGSLLYRSLRYEKILSIPLLLMGAFGFSLLVVILNDPCIHRSVAGVLWSIVPFSLTLGYLTPKLVDQFAAGNPEKAAKAYAVNVLGCILGPLAASYLLLPFIGVKWSLVLLSLLFLPFLWKQILALRRSTLQTKTLTGLGAVLLTFCVYSTVDYDVTSALAYQRYALFRDYAATVICGGEGTKSRIFVNGIAMTGLHQATKDMAHLPLALLPHPPQSALDICFGMGTTFRSLLSWGIQTTAVELIPSVPKAFGYFYPDAGSLMALPRAHVVIDDGRRFLKRTSETYDLITVDPPPPLEAAASSLLYSVEFYELVKKHLKKDGILQQWMPIGDPNTWRAAARALDKSFPYVRVFSSPERLGCHFIASLTPIGKLDAKKMAAKMPPSARKDMEEWIDASAPEHLRSIFSQEMPFQFLIGPKWPAMITDDRPFNEYFLLRRHGL